MEHIKLPKSLRKFIRLEKARIRREVLALQDQEQKIQELYQEIAKRTQKKVKASKEESPVLETSSK